MKLIFLNFLLFKAKHPKDLNEVVIHDKNILNVAFERDYTGLFEKYEYDIISETSEEHLYELHENVNIFKTIEIFDKI